MKTIFLLENHRPLGYTSPSSGERKKTRINYRAFVRFLARVSPHMHHEHVLGFERLLVSRTILPLAYK